MGGTQRLPRMMQTSRALHMIITGETVTPEQAAEWGIVDRLVPEESFDDEVMDYAGKRAAGPSLAQGLAKLSVHRGLESSLAEGLVIERAHQNILFASEDCAEGVTAFLEKREADFRGR